MASATMKFFDFDVTCLTWIIKEVLKRHENESPKGEDISSLGYICGVPKVTSHLFQTFFGRDLEEEAGQTKTKAKGSAIRTIKRDKMCERVHEI